MTVLPLRRKNQVYREVRDDNGIVWTVNKHGVVFRHEPDPDFPGHKLTIFPDRQGPIEDAARQGGLKRCGCC